MTQPLQRLLSVVALCITWALCTSALAQNYIPKQAYQFAPLILEEIQTHFPDIPYDEYVPALIEHESCLSLTHSRCWSTRSQLLSKREQGVGLGQITRTWHADGSLRFDKLEELRTQYKQQLAEVSWSNVRDRPDLQIRMIVLMVRDSYLRLSDVRDVDARLHMVDASYNGGMSGLQRERRVCSLTKGCDAGKWFGHVEHHCQKSRKILYGNRSACDINRRHVQDVFSYRLPKYQRLGYFQ